MEYYNSYAELEMEYSIWYPRGVCAWNIKSNWCSLAAPMPLEYSIEHMFALLYVFGFPNFSIPC